MDVYELDPRRFVLMGHDIIDGGDHRLPRTYYTPSRVPPHRHESYMAAIVDPALPP